MNMTLLPSVEKDVLERLKNGDHQVMAVIMNLFKKNLVCLVSRFVGDDGHASDIVTEAFIKVWEKKEFESLYKIKAFLYVVVKNSWTNYQIRTERRSNSHDEIAYLTKQSEEHTEAKLIKAEIYKLILNEAENLPPARKQIFEMIFLHNLTVKEIATQLNITKDTVRVQKARALNELREQISRKGITCLN